MTELRKAQPGSAPGGYTWNGPDDVVDVPAELAHELLSQPDGGFSEVLPPGPDAEAERLAAEQAEREAAEAAAREAAEAEAKAKAEAVEREAAEREAQAAQEAAEAAACAEAEAKAADDDEGDGHGGKLPTKKPELVALADELGVDSSGTAKEITARLVAHFGEHESRTPITEPDPDANQ